MKSENERSTNIPVSRDSDPVRCPRDVRVADSKQTCPNNAPNTMDNIGVSHMFKWEI